MKTTNTINQPIFDELTYLENKVRQLNHNKESNEKYWKLEDVKEILNKFSMTPRKHYKKFGMKEGVCPYYKWNNQIYLENKVKKLNETGETHSGVNPGEWTVIKFQNYLNDNGMNIMEHYERYGKFDGISAYEGDIPRPGLSPAILEGDGFIYSGSDTCCFLRRELVKIFNDVINDIRKDKPESHKIIVGDASSLLIGDEHRCPNHRTHNNLTEVDIDYPLYSGKGTYYGEDKELIWLIRETDNMVLCEDKVDWEMTYELLIRLKTEVDLNHIKLYAEQGIITKDVKTEFIIHEKIFELIGKHISNDKLERLREIVKLDTWINNNHDRYMHLRLSDK